VANWLGIPFDLVKSIRKTTAEREGSPENFPVFWMGRPNKPTQIPKIFMLFSSYLPRQIIAFETGTHPFQLMYVVEKHLANMLKRGWICNFPLPFNHLFYSVHL
jgi:hypothetical protein